VTRLVREFHEETGQEVADYPTPPDTALARFRAKLIAEEFKEVQEELEFLASRCHSFEAKLGALGRLLKELCDLQYVIEGTAVSLGLPLEDAYRAVHASNMSKRFPDGTFHVNDYGKVLKGPDYRPPDMSAFVILIDAEGVS
jgi:predicted HAD superfamily Cof-like phosphohydrolase